MWWCAVGHVVVGHVILVSTPVPIGLWIFYFFRFGMGLGLGGQGLGLGLDNSMYSQCESTTYLGVSFISAQNFACTHENTTTKKIIPKLKNVVINNVWPNGFHRAPKSSFPLFNNSQHFISVCYCHFKFFVNFSDCHFAECIILYTLQIEVPFSNPKSNFWSNVYL